MVWMKRKIIYLFLALLLPGLIFVFLKRFGKNEFAIPLYHQQGVDSLNSICGTRYEQPYRLPDTVLQKTGWTGGPASLFVFDPAIGEPGELRKIAETFNERELQTIEVSNHQFGNATINRWRSCVFMVRGPWNAVLVDNEKRIRGYYAINSREETDRLILELEILLKKY